MDVTKPHRFTLWVLFRFYFGFNKVLIGFNRVSVRVKGFRRVLIGCNVVGINFNRVLIGF
jgi:hypothetical protein